MVWYSVAVLIDLLVDVFTVRWKTADKDLEILLLRQQLRVLERNLGQRARPSRWEKCFLAIVFVQLKQVTGRSRAQLGKLLNLQAADDPELASRAGASQMDVPAPPSGWPTTDCRGTAPVSHSLGEREHRLGL